MTAAERVLAHFDRISEAPDAIPRLRRFVIELAVHGSLVPPVPGNEPPNLSPSSEAARPVGMPSHWRYARLKLLLAEDTRNGYGRKPDEPLQGTPILRISACTVRSDGRVAEESHKLIGGIDPELRAQYRLGSWRHPRVSLQRQ